jgi:hypothetical protein
LTQMDLNNMKNIVNSNAFYACKKRRAFLSARLTRFNFCSSTYAKFKDRSNERVVKPYGAAR